MLPVNPNYINMQVNMSLTVKQRWCWIEKAQISTQGCSEQQMCAAEGLRSAPARFLLLLLFCLNHPSQPNRTSPNTAQLIFTAQCRSASVRSVCQSSSSRVHLYSFTKSPVSALCHLIPTENTRTRTKTRVWPGVQLHLNAREMRCEECCFALVLLD